MDSSSCRFPFISCEIFTCEIDVILKTLVEDEKVYFIHRVSFYLDLVCSYHCS